MISSFRQPLVIFFFICLYQFSFSQNDPKQKAYEMGKTAIYEMEEGNIEKAILILEECKGLDPENANYPYEIAYAHYLNKDYKAASKILKNVIKKYEENDRVWQMLGNTYDLMGNPQKAIKTYEEGLERFPNSGILYLERGNMEMLEKEYNEALGYYEKGILAEPTFPSNYYWASKIYMGSNQEVYGLIYGEIFMNLERGSKRTEDISALLYKVYESQISFESDTSISVSFCQQNDINITIEDLKELKLPFCMLFETTFSIALTETKEIDLESLNNARTNFLTNYQTGKFKENYPIALYDYQQEIMDAGHFEAYNYWLLGKGDTLTSEVWFDVQREKFNAFIDWYSENPMEIDPDKFDHSSKL
jgi:tetratricopeptide (TPR) repeat protein